MQNEKRDILDGPEKLSIFKIETPYGGMYITGGTYKEETGWEGPHTKRIRSLVNSYTQGIWESEVSKYLLSENFEVFYDIGAAYGYFSLLTSSKDCVKEVISVEPHPVRFGMLWYTVANNSKIFPYNCLVSCDKDTVVNVGGHLSGMIEHHNNVPVNPGNFNPTVKELNELYTPGKDSVIKIDVEGFEQQVLQSGQEALADKNSRIIIEIHKNRVPVLDVIQYMNKFNKKVKKELLQSSIVQTLLFE